jgi:hypothetical protein
LTTPNQPQTNPKVEEAARPELARIEPQKEGKECKETTFFPNPKPPTEKKAPDHPRPKTTAKPKTSPPPIGEARRQFIEDLTAWAQEGAPGVNATRVLDLWLYQCEAHHYAWPDWRGMARWKLREAYYALQDEVAHPQPAAPAAPPVLESWQQPPPDPVPPEELQEILRGLKYRRS